jgi:hypothetical protein
MHTPLAIIVSSVFAALALWHFAMAMRMQSGMVSGAVPSVDGKPLFSPSRQGTVAVGIVLILFALLVAATAGIVSIGLSGGFLVWASYILAAGLMMRAIGEFKYVGLFKKVRGSKFATLDTLIYSPLCLLLSIGVAVVAGNPRV